MFVWTINARIWQDWYFRRNWYLKTNASKECDICHYWYFKDIGFKYEPHLCNGCHDLMQRAMNFNDFATVSVKESDYEIHFWYASKYYAINIIKDSKLDKKVDYYKFFSLYIKMSETIYYQKKKGNNIK